MAAKKNEPPPQGYRPIVLLEGAMGGANGLDDLLVPGKLAAELNSYRATLTRNSPAEAYAKAAAALPRRLLDPVTRRKVLAAIGTESAEGEARDWDAREEESAERDEEDNEQGGQDRNPNPFAGLTASLKCDAYPAASPSHKPAPALEKTEPTKRAHGELCPRGVHMHVFGDDAFDAWRSKIDQLLSGAISKHSDDGKRARTMKDLQDRGPARLVMLLPDWQEKLQTLEREMPNFGHVIEAVARQCSLSRCTSSALNIHPLLLAGGPGVGKSYFAKRLALALELPSYTYHLESAESNSIMLGTERHWSNSEPGVLFKMFADRDLANPVIVLDEIDKGPSRSGQYRPRDSLIPLLERSTARSLRDKSAEVVFDGSWVIYVATANALSPIERPLLSRFEIHHVRDLEPKEAVGVVRAMHDSIRKELGLERFARPEQNLVQELALLANPRVINKALRRAFAGAVEARGTDDNALRLADLGFEFGQAAGLH
ncbi:AAA family ATPase [Pseudaquabacterium pictum]|uniref:AAA+ ATPase domain-containing protein n=1 Tax=Pseudaquabacterium pictum TaxID=2315236 RepID=A0A480AYX4_9BURK|nr:AAA family ATPase [Rubrivivax pictus]GCL66126.1 hypothetical protein AQPW35_52070 [Rubrivivax pictus]